MQPLKEKVLRDIVVTIATDHPTPERGLKRCLLWIRFGRNKSERRNLWLGGCALLRLATTPLIHLLIHNHIGGAFNPFRIISQRWLHYIIIYSASSLVEVIGSHFAIINVSDKSPTYIFIHRYQSGFRSHRYRVPRWSHLPNAGLDSFIALQKLEVRCSPSYYQQHNGFFLTRTSKQSADASRHHSLQW